MKGHDHSTGVNHKLCAHDKRNYCSFYDTQTIPSPQTYVPQGLNTILWFGFHKFCLHTGKLMCSFKKTKQLQRAHLLFVTITQRLNQNDYFTCESSLSIYTSLWTWIIVASSGLDMRLLLCDIFAREFVCKSNFWLFDHFLCEPHHGMLMCTNDN